MQHHIPGNEPIAAEWAPIPEIEPRFGFSRTTTNRLIAEQLIIACKLGGRTLVNIASVHRYMASLPRAVIKPDDRSAKLARRARVGPVRSPPASVGSPTNVAPT